MCACIYAASLSFDPSKFLTWSRFTSFPSQYFILLKSLAICGSKNETKVLLDIALLLLLYKRVMSFQI